MRLALLVCLGLVGCATLSDPPLPKQPDAPTSVGIVDTVGKEQDKIDGRVAAAVVVASESADKPAVVKAELGVASAYLPKPSEGDLAFARQRAAKADEKTYAEAREYGKKLLARIDANWAKMEADTAEAKRVSQLKDARIIELGKEIERVKKDASKNLWTMAGVGIAVVGALATAFASARVGIPLLACGAAIGAFPFVIESPFFNIIAGTTLAILACIGIWYAWSKVRKSAEDAPAQSPQAPDEQAPKG
jgi:hypothetical protein